MLLAISIVAASLSSQGRPTAGGPAQDHPQPEAAELPAGHRRMQAELERVRRAALAGDPYVGRGEEDELRERLERLSPGERPQRRVKLLRELGRHHLRLGELEPALDFLKEAFALRPLLDGKVDPVELEQDQLQLALAWLRFGETQNCVSHHGPESCLLPIQGDGVHDDPLGSRRALELLLDLLERHPDHLACAWLANLAAMTLGEWPDAVPEVHRVPAERFARTEGFPRFDEDAHALGLDRLDMCGGAVAEDFDGDGILDLVTSTWDPGVEPTFYRGLGGGSFEPVDAGLAGIYGGLNLVHADYDGDGDDDLLVLRGAWQLAGGRVPSSLLANRGDGTFVDVTFEVGLGAALPTQTAAFADYDNDGDLDLYVGNESTRTLEAPSALYRNRGDGTFEDVAAAAGITNDRFAKGVAWGDVDGDGRVDLYVSNRNEANRLYRNRGDGSFEDVAEQAGVTGPLASFPTWFFDYDNDGDLDLYVATWESSVDAVAAYYLGVPREGERACLYRNDGRGGFVDVAREVGLTEPTVTMGSNFGDLDGDGFLDFYLGTGYPGFEGLMPNKLFWNRGGRSFVDATTAAGVGHVQKGHAVVFADLDGDGDTDLFEQVGGAFPGDRFQNAFFRNPGFGYHWVALRLVGRESNRSAIGARIRCTVELGGEQPRERRTLYRTVGTGGSFGGNPLTQTLGLGQAERVVELEVRWPATGRIQVFDHVPLDRSMVLVEGADELTAR